ncbi:hypothetical protein [Novosphingobium sp. FKTRR1]|uniref:hypothetical protein n=1 Tax=Novosphingobium sp. FKTRR1 TaxID=2879118 RepID=UPI001CF0D08A|nr:hypothetical protein [Novosphingobium sp. FKTRR1]
MLRAHGYHARQPPACPSGGPERAWHEHANAKGYPKALHRLILYAVNRQVGFASAVGNVDANRLVRRHFEVMEEQQLVAAGVLDHNLRIACTAYAVLNRTPMPPVAAPVTAPEAEPLRKVAPPVVVISERARPDNLRARLGLR